MEGNIPFDPSLILGGVVHKSKVKILEDISALQSVISKSRVMLNSSLALKRSLEMTIIELIDMNLDVSQISEEMKKIEKEIIDNAKNYITVKLENERKITELENTINIIGHSIESPIDFEKTKITNLPLASESLKLEIQYFAFSEGGAKKDQMIESMKKAISNATGELTEARSNALATAAVDQAKTQMLRYNVEGVILITALCTHKNVTVLSPLELDINKTMDLWNRMYEDDRIEVSSGDIGSIGNGSANNSSDNKLTLISGMSHCSSLVGMIHITKSNKPKNLSMMNDQTRETIENIVQKKLYLAGSSCDVFSDKSTMDEIQSVLSNNNVSSHVTITTIGSIPSITSNNMKDIAKGLTEFNSKTVSKITEKHDKSEIKSTNSIINDGKEKKDIANIESDKIKNILTTLSDIDFTQSKVIDVNSLMTALDDFFANARKTGKEDVTGAPMHFYLKELTKSNILRYVNNKRYSDLKEEKSKISKDSSK